MTIPVVARDKCLVYNIKRGVKLDANAIYDVISARNSYNLMHDISMSFKKSESDRALLLGMFS